MPGPAPKHPRDKRHGTPVIAMTQLPAGGRKGPVPEWPISPKARKAEMDIWKQIWTIPQAAAWEKFEYHRTVARYVRLLVEAEKPNAVVTLQAEVRQLEDRLGLNPMSMLRLRWEVAEDEVADKRQTVPARERLKIADPHAVER